MCTPFNRRVCERHQATKSVFLSCLQEARSEVRSRINDLTRGIGNEQLRDRVRASVAIWTENGLLTLVGDAAECVGLLDARDDRLLCTRCHDDSVKKVMSALKHMERVEGIVKKRTLSER